MTVQILVGDVRERLAGIASASINCVVTSPPYWGLRNYGVEGQIGVESSPDKYVSVMIDVFREVRRVLCDAGTLWLNLGDSYNNFRVSKGPGRALHGRDKLNGKPAPDSGRRGWPGLKEKDLIGMPWRVAFALQADGWYLRSDIIWHKPDPMPESVKDRPTNAHEHIFLLTKGSRYYYDAEAVKEACVNPRWMYVAPASPGNHNRQDGGCTRRVPSSAVNPRNENGTRNLRNVWTIATAVFPGALSGSHFATFPPALIEPCIKAGCPVGGTVLDPFLGSGTTALVADRLGRNCIGIELNDSYAAMARARIERDAGMFTPFTEAAE